MQISNYEVWEVTGSGEKEIKLVNNITGNRVVSSMYLNPKSDCDIVVKGYVSNDNEGVELSAVNLGSLAKASEVSTAGVYLYIVEPYEKVSIEVDGTADIGIKCLF